VENTLRSNFGGVFGLHGAKRKTTEKHHRFGKLFTKKGFGMFIK